MRNFIKKDNVLQKRNGYVSVGKHKINGIWEINFRNRSFYIVHIKTSLYVVEDIDTYDIFSRNYTKIQIDTSNEGYIKDVRSWGIFTNDRLYLLCGNYCVLKLSDTYKEGYSEQVVNGLQIYFKFSRVLDDEDTYVPTTTINITYRDNLLGVERQQLDNINMMSSYRINKMISEVVGETGSEKPNYNKYGTSFKVLREYYFDGTAIAFSYIKISFIDSKNEVRTITPSIVEAQDAYGNSLGYYHLQVNKEDLGNAEFDSGLTESTYLYIGRVYSKAMELFYDFKTPNGYENNIEVKFKTSNIDSSLIDNCTFGILYGANGNRNRLFLSGNESKPNVDYHSSRRNIYASDSDIDLDDSQDFTYFSVYDYCAYGTSNTKITDYRINGDGTLVVLKEESINEPSIYFRKAIYQTRTIKYANYSTEVYEEAFPLYVGNIGVGPHKGTRGTFLDLNNDGMFVSSNGIYGISSTINASALNSDYSYAYGRSKLINNRLSLLIKKATNIATCVYDNKYYITIKDKDSNYFTFIADGRYIVLNNKLYYTNAHGLYRLDDESNNYCDNERFSVVNGDIDIDYTNDKLVVSTDTFKAINGNTTFQFDNNEERYYVKFNEVVENGIVGRSKKISKIAFDNLNDLTNEVYLLVNGVKVQVYAKQIENEEGVFQLYSDIDFTYEYLGSGNTFYISTKNRDYKFKKLEDEDGNEYIKCFVDIYENDVQITDELDDDGDNITVALGVLTNNENVECYYITKSFNCGQSVYNKILRSITVINDSELFSVVNLELITKEIKKRFDNSITSGTNGLEDTYKNIFKSDLTNYSFQTSFTKNYLLKFNFIQFNFYNKDNSNCVINNLTINYTYGFKQLGVS